MLELTAVVRADRHAYTATAPELDVRAEGPTVADALLNLKQAVALHLAGDGQAFFTRYDLA